MNDWIERELDTIASGGQTRCVTSWSALGPYLQRDGRRYCNLASNDYLGLTACDSVREAAARAAREVGPGATASRLLAGTCTLHQQLEESLAVWKGHPAALLFSSGYLAAQGIIPLLAGRGDLIVADRLSHACLLDAARLSGAKLLRFRHNDVPHADRLLEQRVRHRRCLLVTESVFSMDGDCAPIDSLLQLAASYDARLLVDEAHALGVCGPRGAGWTADAPEAADRLVTLGTLGKSLASAGGFITCSRSLRELMINRARSFIFDTALPPPTVAAALAALAAIQSHPSWPAHVQSKAERLRTRLRAGGGNILRSESHIVPVLVGDNQTVLALAAYLRERNLVVAAVRPPSVAPGTARLRLTVSLAHADADLDSAAEAILDATRAVA